MLIIVGVAIIAIILVTTSHMFAINHRLSQEFRDDNALRT